jgi:hypothetical protein
MPCILYRHDHTDAHMANSVHRPVPSTAERKCFSLRPGASPGHGRRRVRCCALRASNAEAPPGVAISGGWFPVTTGTLNPPMSTDGPYDGRWPHSDEDIYLAITTAWCRMFTRAERRKHPLGPYVLGESFTRSVARAPIDSLRVTAACARVACLHMHGERESWPADLSPQEALDPAAAWWCAIDEPDGLGVHHVELGGGTLEFLSVAYFDDRPKLESFE